ncbi:MAG: hypothetical protein M1838_002750 [Thelocarpon superellum]|nr:MAG: hypothetical protein M1838_002750 [Thelocarpon superellum]
MEEFNPLNHPFLDGALALAETSITNNPEALMGSAALDLTDHLSHFGPDPIGGNDDSFGSATFGPLSSKGFAGGFDDPFSEHTGPWENVAPEADGADRPAVDRNHKLLSFSPPTFHYGLLDYAENRVSASVSAQLHGMFFLAESPWAVEGQASGLSSELTCYRRNLFQISGSVMLPRALRFVLTERGERIPVMAQELSVSATESVEGNPVKLISVPWKTPASTVPAPEDRAEREPPSLPLDLLLNADVDADYATCPVAWKRLQFRIATANNGRRKELQQHFTVRLKVMATLATGTKVSICEVQSGAIIVRGRSPRNFKSGKDLPLSGSAATSRRTGLQGPSTGHSRTLTSDSSFLDPGNDLNPSSGLAPPLPSDRGDLQMTPDLLDWMKMSEQEVPVSSSDVGVRPGDAISAYAEGNLTSTRPPIGHGPPSFAGPITLSLTEDETPRKRPSASAGESGFGGSSQPHKIARLSSIPRPSSDPTMSGLLGMGSPDTDESADLLYEYFPLGLDDWMPPVDAVYRPHVVHHTNNPEDPKAQAAKERSRRYFSREESSS